MFIYKLGIGTRVSLLTRLPGCRIRPLGWRSREVSTSYRTFFSVRHFCYPSERICFRWYFSKEIGELSQDFNF